MQGYSAPVTARDKKLLEKSRARTLPEKAFGNTDHLQQSSVQEELKQPAAFPLLSSSHQEVERMEMFSSVFTRMLRALLNISSGLIRVPLSVCSGSRVARKTDFVPAASAGGRIQPSLVQGS